MPCPVPHCTWHAAVVSQLAPLQHQQQQQQHTDEVHECMMVHHAHSRSCQGPSTAHIVCTPRLLVHLWVACVPRNAPPIQWQTEEF